MCQLNTAIRSLEGATQADDLGALHVVESALQLVATLDKEAEPAGVPLKEYLRHIRLAYVESSVRAGRRQGDDL